MNYKEEITKLIRASYDQGVKDAQQEAIAALEQMIVAARADEREACAKLCEAVRETIWEYHEEHLKAAACNVCTHLAVAIRARGQA